MPLFEGERVALLARATEKYALQHVLFDRDEGDSNRIQIEEVRPSPDQLSRSQVMRALPVGSRWTGAIGWESYVVFPPRELETRNLAIIGLEYVLSHPSRGAYPVFAGAVLEERDVARVLREIVEGLGGEQADVDVVPGVVRSDVQAPQNYRKDAARLLQKASSSFDEKRPLLVRTVIMTEDEVPKWLLLRTVFRRPVLLGTVEPLRRHFSRKIQAQLRLAES